VKIWLALIGLLVCILFFAPACGGGGTSSNNTTTSTTATTGDPIVLYDVEATVGGTTIDPTNIMVGETAQFVVAGYTASGVRSVLTSSNWIANPPGDTEGTMTSSGQYTASAYGPSLFVVTGTANGNPRNGSARVVQSGQAVVTGRIVDGYGGNVPTLEVDFYDGASNLVGTSISQWNGTFRASVPATATTFEIKKASIPITFYKEYFYINKWYLPLGFCRAPLPALSNGTTTPLIGNITVPPTSHNGTGTAPPPPPSPCS
jgi:hypothetical protein